MPDFTVEEINLMCIFDTADRVTLLDGIRESLPHVYELEMKTLMQAVIVKVERMTDEEFSELAFIPADEFDDVEV